MAMVVGLTLIVILGVAALAVDGSLLYSLRSQLQATADSAALTGTYKGVPFFMDPSNHPDALAVKFKVAGTVTANLDGVI